MSIICCKDIQRAVEMLLIDAARLASGLLPAPPSPATIFLRKMSRRTCWSRGLATTNSVPNDVTYNMRASKPKKSFASSSKLTVASTRSKAIGNEGCIAGPIKSLPLPLLSQQFQRRVASQPSNIDNDTVGNSRMAYLCSS